MNRSYDYEDGLRDHCVDDPLWAADEIERLRSAGDALARYIVDNGPGSDDDLSVLALWREVNP